MPIDWGAVRSAALGGAKVGWKSALEMPAVRGAITGAAVGGLWGMVSDRESVMGGAMKGAMVGGLARTGWNYGKGFKGLSSMYDKAAKLQQAKNWQGNLRTAWNTMWNKRYRGATMTIGGLAALRAAGGLVSPDDNPIGGTIGGGVAGAIQGGAAYGGYRAIKRFMR